MGAGDKPIWVGAETHDRCKKLAARLTLLDHPVTMRVVVQRAFDALEKEIEALEEVQREEAS